MAKGVLINPSVIQWAIRTSGKNLNSLYEKYEKLNQWINEPSELSVSQLNKLSKDLKIPFGYFFLNEPPIEDIKLLNYRTIDSEKSDQPSRDLIDTIKSMELKQSFMKDSLIEDGFLPLDYIGSASLEDNPEKLAQNIKKYLGLQENWNRTSSNVYKHLRNTVSNAGIMVMENGVVGTNNTRKLDLKEFRAFVIVDEYVPLIFINALDSKKGKIFSLCHEIVHIWLGLDELYNDNYGTNQNFNDRKLEAFCNEVAAEILLPSRTIRALYNEKTDIYESIDTISNNYNISEFVVCIRLKKLEAIDTDTFDTVYSEYLEKMKVNLNKKNDGKNEKQSGGNYYHTKGARLDSSFVHTVNRKAREGKILYTEAYDLVEARGNTYDNLVNYMEGRA